MQVKICPSCGHKNEALVQKCVKCGGSLGTRRLDKRSTMYQFSLVLTGNLPTPPIQIDVKGDGSIALMLEGFKNRIIQADLEGNIVKLGRTDEKSPWANLNLEPYEGLVLGVSRKHCQIQRIVESEKSVFKIEDLGSTNGTWVNGIRLTPGNPARLASGDYVQLGQLAFWVFLPARPAQNQT